MPHCFVRGCKCSERKRPEGVTFHKIPKELQKEWLRFANRDENTLIIQQRICSLHFRDDDFMTTGEYRRLKPDVIPSRTIQFKKPIELKQAVVIKEECVTEVFVKIESPVYQEPEIHPDRTSDSVEDRVLDTETLEKAPKKEVDFDYNSKETTVPEKFKINSQFISTIHSYSRSSKNYEKQLSDSNVKASYYKKKLKNALRTSARRKEKIVYLRQVVNHLRKKCLLLKNVKDISR